MRFILFANTDGAREFKKREFLIGVNGVGVCWLIFAAHTGGSAGIGKECAFPTKVKVIDRKCSSINQYLLLAVSE